MTGDEVRELIGPPLVRHRFEGGTQNRVVWVYTGATNPGSVAQLVVAFDLTSLRVLNTAVWNMRNATASVFPKRPSLERFDSPMVQGESPRLDGYGPRYLIQIMASWCAPCSRQRPRIEELLREQDLGRPTQLLLVSVDEDKDAIVRYLDKNKISAPVAWDPERKLHKRFWDGGGIPRNLVLEGDLICPFDFPHHSGWTEEFFGDLHWFLKISDFESYVVSR